ncbi:MAG TPA: phosphatase PAP2 family protein [Mycobacteriales bacterium]|jgi:undecaprenyl-diphosphatase|nr:phosphatase PAP2 family protein [Mycobacteriales bacterium]
MLSRLADRLHAADERLFTRAATSHNATIDVVLPRLTRAADHGVLWLGVAAALAASGRPGRRAAARGLTSLAVSSAVVNGPAKWVFRRSRPDYTLVPALRQLRRQPRTTSFPSGHSASAAAFATGVALQAPAVGIPIAVVAAAVAYSRVHTGVHYPSDVVVGAAIGAGTAVALRRAWPVVPERPATTRASTRETPDVGDGAGLVVVINNDAGSGAAEPIKQLVSERLPAAEVVVAEDGDDVVKCLHEAAHRAQVLGVAGGDGTVASAATVAVDEDVPLAVFPAGTLNHFAHELGIESPDDTIDALQAGAAAEVVLASAAEDGESLLFLNTFSLGVYPELVQRRERRERWLGKWVALGVALVEVLHRAEPLELEVDGERRVVWLLFAGNGRYHPPGFAPSWRERLDDDCVDVRIIDADKPLGRSRLVLAVLSGTLGRCRVYEERVVDRMRIRLPGEDERMARDGETHTAPRELLLRPASRRLVVFRPARS